MLKANDLIVQRPEGLYCPAGDFYIDPWRPVSRAVITHAHADHIAGLPLVFENYEVAGFLEPEVFCDTAVCGELESVIKNRLVQKQLQ